MQNDTEEVGKFVFGLRLSRHKDGKFELEIQTFNQGVPEEIVIMNMKAYFQTAEKNFYDNFNAANK